MKLAMITRILHALANARHLLILSAGLLLSLPASAGVVLLYHHVADDTPAITSISPDQFSRHLDILEEESVTVLPLEQLVSRGLSADRPLDKIAAITFDDAYSSIYSNAYPMLKARGLPFTIFVATSQISNTNPAFLSWSQLTEMSQNGAHIANHSVSHAHLIRKESSESKEHWRKRVTSEIVQARDTLAANGFLSDYFAYPYGEYNPELLEIVESLGMTGFGQQSGAIGPHAIRTLLPRFPLAGIYTGEGPLRDKIRSLGMPIRGNPVDPLISKNIHNNSGPVLVLEFLEAPKNRSQLACYGPEGQLKVNWETSLVASASATRPLPSGRSRYNCTLPADGRFYWFSQLWIKQQGNGEWHPEP